MKHKVFESFWQSHLEATEGSPEGKVSQMPLWFCLVAKKIRERSCGGCSTYRFQVRHVGERKISVFVSGRALVERASRVSYIMACVVTVT